MDPEIDDLPEHERMRYTVVVDSLWEVALKSVSLYFIRNNIRT